MWENESSQRPFQRHWRKLGVIVIVTVIIIIIIIILALK